MKKTKDTTELGHNRTGIAANPAEARKTYEGAQIQATPGNEKEAGELRIVAAREAPGIGSLPMSSGGSDGARRLSKNGELSLLLDKMGERAAFERTGVRLYDAFIAKLQGVDGHADSVLAAARRIRDQELDHFHLVCREIRALGGDDTAMSPCADATGVATRGILQVLCDPRSSIAQSIGALLTAELTDHAGWELLIRLCAAMDLNKPASLFELALQQEGEHLLLVRSWLNDELASQVPALNAHPGAGNVNGGSKVRVRRTRLPAGRRGGRARR